MQQIIKEITKEEYERYEADPIAFANWRETDIPQARALGYGCYGVRCYERDGKYYQEDKIGDTCD